MYIGDITRRVNAERSRDGLRSLSRLGTLPLTTQLFRLACGRAPTLLRYLASPPPSPENSTPRRAPTLEAPVASPTCCVNNAHGSSAWHLSPFRIHETYTHPPPPLRPPQPPTSAPPPSAGRPSSREQLPVLLSSLSRRWDKFCFIDRSCPSHCRDSESKWTASGARFRARLCLDSHPNIGRDWEATTKYFRHFFFYRLAWNSADYFDRGFS